jgi:hypothetical protein
MFSITLDRRYEPPVIYRCDIFAFSSSMFDWTTAGQGSRSALTTAVMQFNGGI